MPEQQPPVIVVPGPERVEYVTRKVEVHEHRAPTDKSVALLKEMEAAAQRKVVEAIHIGDTTFECVVHIEKDMMADCTRLRAVFKLNGRTETAEHSCRPRNPGDELTAANALRDEVAKVIASKMIASAFAQMYRSN